MGWGDLMWNEWGRMWGVDGNVSWLILLMFVRANIMIEYSLGFINGAIYSHTEITEEILWLKFTESLLN